MLFRSLGIAALIIAILAKAASALEPTHTDANAIANFLIFLKINQLDVSVSAQPAVKLIESLVFDIKCKFTHIQRPQLPVNSSWC